MNSLRVTVIGCGIAGASVATMLARRGHRVTLLEQSHRVGPVGAGILLQPAGQDVLWEMGLLDEVVARAEPIRSIEADRITRHGRRRLVRIPYGHRHAFGLHRGDLFASLHDALLDAGVDLQLGRRTDAVPTDVDLVIIADGSRSSLRTHVDPDAKVHEYTHGALWAVGKGTVVRGRLFQVARGTTILCGLLPMGDDRCSLFWGLPLQEEAALRFAGPGGFLEQVRAAMPEVESILTGLTSLDDLTLATYRHVRMRRWHRGNVVVIGDAAHAMSPHLGQGVNLALCDAKALADAIDASGDVLTALSRYERKRRRQLRWYSLVTRRFSPFFQGDRDWLARPRDWALPWLPQVPGVGRVMRKTLRGEAFLK